ncbi:nickel pincer cofactor biosynthesis protein LarB [Nocardia xishanensis]|uniref:nickel pincer cofactor biosynthesis protein LarB n=1 Tax=Nocardia xishanensis TaxID=238964 RepID=UPI000836ED55|nr:nickel pincer cofactor biosynthesis protein LarB [Nocardia xishanensis]
MNPVEAAEVNLDFDRARRIGFGEAVLSDAKSLEQLVDVLGRVDAADRSILLTRLSASRFSALPDRFQCRMDYDSVSRTAFFGSAADIAGDPEIAVVSGGTSDVSVAREAVRTLTFHGRPVTEVYDVGVAGLWRLQERLPDISRHRIVIAVAGMEAALPTVLAGLIPSLVVAVPTSVGYGVSGGGETALRSVLASCVPGVVVVNIDNGYGAACAAMRALS